jgi:hypothetical protein
MEIYTDELKPGWEDWAWDATRDLAARDQVYSGTRAISVRLDSYGGLSFWHPAFRSGPFDYLEFYVRGSVAEGQHLRVFIHSEDGTELHGERVECTRYIEEGTIGPGTWKQVRIPLRDLNAAERYLVQVSIQDRRGQASTAFWVDEIQLAGAGSHELYLPVILRN